MNDCQLNILLKFDFSKDQVNSMMMLFLSISVSRWTVQQTEYLRMRCSQQIAFNTTLRKGEAEKIIDEMPSLLRNRTWKDVKNKVSFTFFKVVMTEPVAAHASDLRV